MKQYPELSSHFESLKPSSIREAANLFDERSDHDEVTVINMAIGNVTLPMHPAMIHRMHSLGDLSSPFTNGVVPYMRSRGTDETRQAFLNVLDASGVDIDGLSCQITEGASQGIALILAGVCGPSGSNEKPLLVFDATYTNYMAFAKSSGRRIVNVTRHLGQDGRFAFPNLEELEALIEKENPGAILVIPFDNPTGQHMRRADLIKVANLCVEHNLWLVSDEAYRELNYDGKPLSSVWTLNESEVPGITGRRISLESTSKVWNACGLRIGAMITDNRQFFEKSIFENMANLCANTIGQYIFGALAHESHADIRIWFEKQRDYYRGVITHFVETIKEEVPGVIASRPDAAIYTVVDVRNLVDDNFSAAEFVHFCAKEGRVKIDDQFYTILVSPMAGFYNDEREGNTQMRIAFVDPREMVEKTPRIFGKLLKNFLSSR
ncbi:MAG: aminotransferase class I/II-fold pyridoxal phosphate-dependent enzyme [Candidatus Marinimicrobia bacterium]|nr:aminotransferase class I/II-fold pyridoxal phosphate-dependent enzyme [Candidatus Neomarinimicrobiota bacterium]